MLSQPAYEWPGTDADLVRLVTAHPWATLVSATDDGLVVSHVPVLADPPLTLLGHLPAADARQHRVGEADAVVVVAGPHGYVSAGWYAGGPSVSTWNYVVAHFHGRLAPLGPDETFTVLARTQDHFESVRPEPHTIDRVEDYARRIAPGVVGFRLVPSRVQAKAKLSQDKPVADVEGVLRGLEDPLDVHTDPSLAAAMRHGGIPG